MPGRNISRTRTTRRKPANSTTQSKAKTTPEAEQPPTDNSSKIVPMPLTNDADAAKELPKTLDLKPAPTETALVHHTNESHLHIAETIIDMGEHRPIIESELEISGTIEASGTRPIVASHLHISDTSILNRPIANNDPDHTNNLMGYLD